MRLEWEDGMLSRTLVLASGNVGKLQEMRELLVSVGCRLRSQAEWDLESAPEPFDTFLENALAKARHAAQHTGLPALADDAGLCIDAWQGCPGVRTARYAQSRGYRATGDEHNVSAILADMAGEKNRRAQLVCTLVAIRHPKDPQPLIATGCLNGELTEVPMGEEGFGFDPVLYISELGGTFGQLGTAIKNAHSHRAQAIRIMRRLMAENWAWGSIQACTQAR
jgi:XTP/dITP diphosphohydrolase